jgi:hypothetical protein
MSKTPFLILCSMAWLIGLTSAYSAADENRLHVPDLTQGDTVPARHKHDWNLGPVGLRGWMFCDQLVTTDARQIAITAVDSGSPAAGILSVGDVILGVGGRRFAYDPRTEFGLAVSAAETETEKGRLVLTRWRDGQIEDVTLTLPIAGTFSSTAPYDCDKSKWILRRGLQVLAERAAQPDYGQQTDAIPRALNALALLAGGEAAHLELVQREARWAADFATDDFRTWYYGYVMIFLSEYVLATNDQSVLPGLRRLALDSARGQSAVGSWGHTFAAPDGRLRGYGMMNSPGLPLTIGMVLARDAGVNDPEIARAIDLSSRLLRFYTGKGAVPYGDHAAWTETHEDNGKCGMAAVLFNSLGEARSADYFTRMALASHGSERDCGHTGNYFNLLWSLPAIAQAGPQATGAWMREFGGWYHDLARRHDGSFAHQGPPEPDHDSYHGWDATGAFLLGYALPLRKIRLTGRTPAVAETLSADAAQSIVADGRGWNNKDRRSCYEQLPDAELIRRLGSWSPIVRERAAMAISWRMQPPLSEVISLLDSDSLDARVGACHALEQLRGDGAPAVPQLRNLLQHEDLWLRIRAASALAAIGRPAAVALPELLDQIARDPAADDPRGMEQRFVAMAVFSNLLPRLESLADIDGVRLQAAIARGLQNQDGRARGEISEIYRRLNYDQIQPLLPVVYAAIRTPAPSGEMFADSVRLNGLKILATHHITEGMQAATDYLRTQNPWASEHRTPEILQVLADYGASAQSLIPQLEETAAGFDRGEPDFPRNLSRQKARAVRETIAKIRAAKETPELKPLSGSGDSAP